MAAFPKIADNKDRTMENLIGFNLYPTTKRLTFDVRYMHPDLIYMGEDDGDYFVFTASNGYQVISRSRMDIQTERLWLLGAKWHTSEGSRSGTMVFSDTAKRDKAAEAFLRALLEWGRHVLDKPELEWHD